MHFVFEEDMFVVVIEGDNNDDDDNDDNGVDKEMQLMISLLVLVTMCVKRIPVTSMPMLAEMMLLPIENNNNNEK